jgi:hypothetical protein
MGKGAGLRESRYEHVLQAKLKPDDLDNEKSWIFNIPNLPNRQRLLAHNNNEDENLSKNKNNGYQENQKGKGANGDKMSIMSISVTPEQSLVLSIEKVSINRILIASAHCPEELIAISFANLEFPGALPKVTSAYIERLLSTGIELM